MSDAGSLTTEAYLQIRADILSCRLLPGGKLNISDLCAARGFSLGAVREALSRLTSEGLVQAEPRKGFRVAPVSEDELRDINDVLCTIECLCLESAIENGDLKWEAGVVSTLFELSRLPANDPDDPARISETWAETHQRFHRALVAACTSPWLLKLREILFVQSERYLRVSVPLDTSGRDLNADHKKIANASIARDKAAATIAMRDHLTRTTRILLAADVGSQ
jgi:DNA-binding GntR family transcriptional regulator